MTRPAGEAESAAAKGRKRGWAVARWTAIRDAYDVHIAAPGATVFEVSDGKVVRATLYHDSNDISLTP